MSCKIRVVALLSAWVSVPGVLGHHGRHVARASSDNGPKAMSIAPSEYFEGNDGPWSTFDLRVGSNAQDVRVTISTASPETFVVLADSGCSSFAFETVPDNCAVSRGKLFNPNESSSWNPVGLYGINQDGVGLEANLGYYQKAEFALETLGLGLTGPTLKNQTVAGIATAEPFYLGTFGLNTQPVNFTSVGNYTVPSFLTTLKDQGHIPSLSWSYTAGAKYRLKQVYGQLILSGYDTSRFAENSVTFSMAGDLTRDLVVIVQSISYSGTTSKTLLSDPIDIFIDSTDPNLWLPGDVCDAFEDAFGLTLDSASGLYLVNDTHHDMLLNSDAEVTFRLSDVKTGGDTVKITLPYAAFDLRAEYPLVKNSSYYFPLKRADNATQYTLGRTFLQEAYLTADYERKVFNVSACTWNAGAQEDIVTILPSDQCASGSSCTTPGSDPGSGSGSGSGSHSLSGGAIAGIVVGAVLGLLLLAAIAIFFLRRQRKKAEFAAREPEPDMAVLRGPVYNHHSSSRRTGKYYSPDTVGTSTASEQRVSPLAATEHSNSNAGSSALGEGRQQELDARETEITPAVTRSTDEGAGAGAEQTAHQLHSESRSQPDENARGPTPVYHELANTEVTRSEHQQQQQQQHHENDAVSTLGALPSRSTPEREKNGDDHLDSPFVSTLGSMGWQDEEGDANSDLVSPTTPVQRWSKRCST
ncbi:acid protease [Xylariaceae sp. FL0594]|nr:acid protease [Xylariaceae sp. FL0594]